MPRFTTICKILEVLLLLLLISEPAVQAVTVPSNVISYLPITFTNSQASGVSNPFDVQLTVNSLAYQSYEANSLQNIEFFYANGTIVPSWLESNAANSVVQTPYWLKIVGNFLPASSTNTLYIGFALPGNNLFNTANTGEEPGLSASYAQYDTGFTVFPSFYDNFNGVTLGSQWVLVLNANLIINNGLTMNGLGSGTTAIRSKFAANPQSNFAEFDGYYQSLSGIDGKDVASWSQVASANGMFLGTFVGSYSLDNYNGVITAHTNIAGGSITTNNIWTLWGNTLNSFLSLGYGTPISTNSAYLQFASANVYIYSQFSSQNSIIMQWVRSRTIPPGISATNPGGVMPTASFGAISLGGTLISSNSVVDQGQTEVITSSVPGGLSPLSYNYLITNTVASPANIIANAIFPSCSLTSNTFIFTIPTNNNALGTGNINMNAIDAGASQALLTNTITINPALSSVSLVSSNSAPVQGQTITLTYTISGGSPSYTYNFFITNSATANVVANQLYAGVASTSNTFTFTLPTVTNGVGPLTITATATDAATAAENVVVTNTITVGSISLPQGVFAYVPVTLTNSQTSPVTGNTQIQISVNTVNYRAYFVSNLVNAEWFLGNGMVLSSWLEGNVANEIQGGGLSSNIVNYWIDAPGTIAQTFIASSGGTNTIYLGFAPNAFATSALISPSVLMDGAISGEAPQLSTIYGSLDNGGRVFTKYWNFNGTTLPGAFSASSSTGYTVNSGLTTTLGSVYSSSTQFTSAGNVLESLFAITGNPVGGTICYCGMSMSNVPNPGGGNSKSSSEILFLEQPTSNTLLSFAGDGSSASYNLQSSVTVFTATQNTYNVISSFVAPSGASNTIGELVDYLPAASHAGSFANPMYVILGYYAGSSGSTIQNTPQTIKWLRLRTYPPSGVMPAASFGSTQTVSVLLPSNSIASQNQFEAITYYLQNANGQPFTYNFVITNTATGNVIANQIFTGCTLATNTFTFQLPSSGGYTNNDIGGLTISVNAVDSLGYQRLSTNTITVSFLPTKGSFTASNSVGGTIASTQSPTYSPVSTGQVAADTIVYVNGSKYYEEDSDKNLIQSSGTAEQIIQAALNRKGTAYVESGIYNLSMGFNGLNLSASSTLILSPQAVLFVPNGYAGYVFKFYAISRSTLAGGYVAEAGTPQHKWTGILLQGYKTGTYFNRAISTIFANPHDVIQLSGNDLTWGNGNIFDGIQGLNFVNGVNFNYTGSLSANAFSKNVFRNLVLYGYPPTLYGIRNILTGYNDFIDVQTLNLSGSQTTATINSIATSTLVAGGAMTYLNFQDKGSTTRYLNPQLQLTVLNNQQASQTTQFPMNSYALLTNTKVYVSGSTYYEEDSNKKIIQTSATPETLIQDAMNRGGTIFIESGTYSLSGGFAGFNFGTNTTLMLSPQATVVVPSGYTGYVFKFDGVSSSKLLGGYITEASVPQDKWTGVIIQANTVGTLNNQVADISFQESNNIILFNGTHGQWANTNLFDNIVGTNFVNGVTFSYNGYVVGTDGFNRNIFRNLELQTGAQTLYGFKNIDHIGNIFLDSIVWDLTGSQISATVGSDAQNTLIVGFGMTHFNYANNGLNTTVPGTSSNQSQLLTATLSGGQTPYTYNYTVYSPSGLVASALYTGVASTSNTFAFQQLPKWGGGPFTANVIITDSLSVPVPLISTTTYSANTYSLLYSPPLLPTPSTTTIPPVGGAGGGGGFTTGPSTTPPVSTVTTSISTTTIKTSTTSATTTIAIPPKVLIDHLNLNVNNNPLNITVPQSPVSLSINSKFPIFGSLTVTNVTNNVPLLKNYSILTAANVNLTSLANAAIIATINYPCRILTTNLTPFILKNGTWKKIPTYSFNILQDTCQIAFAIPSDPIIGLFFNTMPYVTTSSTTATTSLPTTTTLSISGGQNNDMALPVGISLAVIVIIVALFLIKKGQGKKEVPTASLHKKPAKSLIN